MQHDETKGQDVAMILRFEQVLIAPRVARRECLDNSVYLLCFAWKANLHEELSESDVQRLAIKIELLEKAFQSLDIKGVRAARNVREASETHKR